jgi:uncharacterized protein (TIGR03435 family)
MNCTLKQCVQFAWNVKDFQVNGATGWMDGDRYDIEAVAAARFKEGEYRDMLQTLLADRFGVVAHRETKDRSGYALVVGKNGAKLPPPSDDPSILFSRTPTGDITLKAPNVSMTQLADALMFRIGVPVVNKTGIEGKYDASMQFTPDPSMPAMGKPGMPMTPPPDALPGPSIFTVVQEKLGLKLESTKVPVEVIVIDQAHRPTAN